MTYTTAPTQTAVTPISAPLSAPATTAPPLDLSFEGLAGKLPPQNVQCEEAILGGVLIDPDAISRVIGILKPNYFYVKAHQILFEVMVGLAIANQPIDLLSVAVRLNDLGQLAAIGGRAKLTQLAERTISAVNIDRYAAIVVDKHLRRELIKASRKAEALGYDEAQDLAEILDQVQRDILAIGNARPSETGAYVPEITGDVIGEIEKAIEYGNPAGNPTGFYDFDALTGGLHDGDLIIVAGRPSMGKTAIATQVVWKTSLSKPTAVFSLEMSKEQLDRRLISMESGVNGQRLLSGKMSDHEIGAMYEATGALSASSMYIDDRPNPTIGEMIATCRQIQAERGQLGMVMIDYLQLMSDGGGNGNRTQELSQITRSLKGLARELDVPVIALSQLSRAVESRSDKRPMMSDLRESGALEQDADLILMLYRDEYYNPDTPERGIAEVKIAKHRNGPTGTVKLLFDSSTAQFKNLA